MSDNPDRIEHDDDSEDEEWPPPYACGACGNNYPCPCMLQDEEDDETEQNT